MFSCRMNDFVSEISASDDSLVMVVTLLQFNFWSFFSKWNGRLEKQKSKFSRQEWNQ